MKLTFILLFYLLCTSFVVQAQSGKLFTADKELSNSLINKVYQDRRGIIWIATEDGLNCYDGSKFTIYKHKYLDETSLSSNYVHTLFEDSKRNFYIGLFNGLQTYDYATNTFKAIPLLFEDGGNFDAHVSTILERKNGDILIGTSGQGVFKMQFKDNQPHHAIHLNLPNLNLVTCLYEDKKGDLWVATENRILSRLGKDNQWKHYFINDKTVYSISSFCEDKKGNLYVGSSNKGLFIYNQNTDSFTPIPYPKQTDLPIKSLYVNRTGEIYIGTDGYGIKSYNPHEKKINNGNFNIATFDFSKSKVHSIMEDNSGNIWMGIFQKGVMVLPNSISKFNYIGYKSVNNNIIGSNCVMSICKDHNDNLWVGTDNDGIYIITPDRKQKAHFAPESENTVPSTILCMYEDSNHDFWIGSFRDGMAKINPQTGHCEYIHLVDDSSNKVQRVYGITEDQNKTLWICTMGAGLYSMDLATSRITHYPQVDGTQYGPDKNGLHNGWINCILASRNGKIYIGTYDGIGCLDIASNSFISTYNINRLFQGYIIYSLYEDKDGNIWAGTSHGLALIDNKTKQMHTYNTTNGLPSDVVCAIKGDNNHHLWISTNHGISSLNLKDQTFINYYYSDGLQGNEFSKGAAWIDKEGEIMFGGLNGITYFKPENITNEIKKMEVKVTGFYIHDQLVKKGMKSGSYNIIDTSVMDAKKFHLSHHDNSFSIELSTMEFNNPERIVYTYSMNNENWISLTPGTNRVAFNNLNPGIYSFHIKANDYNAYSDEKEIIIEIFPAWYASVWAKLIYCLILLAVIYLSIQQIRHRYKARKKMQEHLHAEQINEAKLQFFINISHEIRTPMSLIISPLEKLMAIDTNRERQQTYSIIRRNAERILRLINQLMDIRKIDKGQMFLKFQKTEIVNVLQEIYTIFDYQAKNKQIEFKFHHEMDSLDIWIDPKNFDKIIINILSNAFKFTPEHGKIDLYLNIGRKENAPEEKQNYAEIIISDSGIGINTTEMERIFERFYQISNSQNNSNIGTGIGLHLTRSLVELHHGSITVANNENGKGCRFIIHLPLGKDHLAKEEVEETNILPTSILEQPAYSFEELAYDKEDVKVKSKSKRRILVVEDDEEIRKYVCRELAADYHMIESVNGKEALAIILQKTPDLVISDVMMPEMDGVTLCRKIKQNVNVNHIPIILLTAKTREEDNLEGLSIGADAYLTKPFSIEILKKTVANIIKNREILRNTFNGNQHQTENIQEIALKSSDEKLMEKVMNLINENISNPDLSVEMIANQIGISRVHLHRKLKELTNQTTRDLIRNIRLKQAAALLSTGKPIDIAEVAYATGFTNMPYFSSAFKELFGVPPKTFMEEHLKE